MHSATQQSEVVGTSTCAAASVAEEYLGKSWDPLTVVQTMDFIEANRISPCHISRLPLDQELSGLVAGATTLSSCDNGRSQEDMSSFPLYASSLMNGCETNTKGNKRKIVQNLKAEEQHDVSPECFKDPPGKDEKKHKNGLSSAAKNAQGSKDIDASKDDFIHVRAKRGQATNSHSLAERVRREKISERMRLLQDLVPGCSKINGKAMMLDEIINYVQSLQRQVEFLSMKLAAVHPELNFDVEQLLSKQVLQSCYGGPSALAFDPRMSSFQSQLYGSTSQGLTQPEMLYIAPSSEDLQQASLLQMSHMSLLANPWHDELQNTLQMNSIPAETTPTDHNGANALVGGFKSF